MKEKKNIDRIFQEKFKDFEIDPREKVWDNISKELDKKDKKRNLVIPLWFKVGGVAAVLALVLSSILFINNNKPAATEPGIVFENPEQEKDSSNIQSQTNKKEEVTNIATNENPSSKDQEVSNSAGKNIGSATNKGIAEESRTRAENEQSSQRNSKSKKEAASKAERLIASNEGENNSKIKKQIEKEGSAVKPEVIGQDSSGVIAANEKVETKISEPEEDKQEQNALAQLEEASKKKDKEENTSEENLKKIRLSTFAAPVFYKNIGSGNELSSQFSNNSASSEVTVSYGVKVAYALSEKLKIRTGISKINMSYNIQDISYSPTAMAGNFENISPTSDNIAIRSNAGSNAFDNSTASFITSNIFTPGEINQQFGFIEVPLEIEYSLIDKKFGLNIIGGGSSLFLDQNRVDLNSGNTVTSLGKASNINNTSFSTNIGMGLDYRLNDKFSINLEPIFKYQLNTFNNVNNVQPVNFGIYSGLSIKF